MGGKKREPMFRREKKMLPEPVYLANLRTQRVVRVETVDVYEQCQKEVVQFHDPRLGFLKTEKVYRDATAEEIKLWEEEGERKRGERQQEVEDAKIRNAPAVIMVNPESAAGSAAKVAEEAAKPKRGRKKKAAPKEESTPESE